VRATHDSCSYRVNIPNLNTSTGVQLLRHDVRNGHNFNAYWQYSSSQPGIAVNAVSDGGGYGSWVKLCRVEYNVQGLGMAQ
jgi:hypothetical protein